MREIEVSKITEEVAKLCILANYQLGEDVVERFKELKETETSPTAASILDQVVENASIASEGKFPLCQDTGFAVFFVEVAFFFAIKSPL